MNNANVIFGVPGISQNVLSGSLLSFKWQKQGSLKEATDVNDNFLAVAKSKGKRVATISALLVTSGSNAALPELLTPATITSTGNADMTGSYYVSGQPAIDWKNDDFTKFDIEVTQWLTSTGTL